MPNFPMKIFLSVSALIFLSVLPVCASASGSDFADSLFREGDYLNAAHEYKRILFLHPDTPHIDFVAFRVAASYQNAGRLERAIRAYQFLIDTYPDSPLVERSTNNIAQCHILFGDKDRGIAALENFLSKHKTSDLAPLAQFTIGMLHIEKREWAAARRVWNEVSFTYPESRFAEVSATLAGIVESVDTLPRRSPTVAGVLSALVPGGGQLYSGRRVDGFYTFMSVTVFGSASVYYTRAERYEVAIPVAVLGLILYGNNIYQGIRAAETFNLQHEGRFRNQIQQEIRDSGLFGAISTPKDNVKLTLWHSRF